MVNSTQKPPQPQPANPLNAQQGHPAPASLGAKAIRPDAPRALRVQFENIPRQLASLNQWVLWRYQPTENGHTKVPFQPSGEKASTTGAATWSSFEEVRAAYERGGFAGVGFVLTPETGFIGVDMDKQRAENGEWSAEVKAQINTLQTYGEISPSGRGVRFFGVGTLPDTGRKRGNFEVYNGGRYLTLTGHQLPDTPDTVNHCGAALLDFHARHIAAPVAPRPAPSAPQTTPDLGDAALLDKAHSARNGAKFRALWNGDTTAHNSDHSAADAALISLLRYWTGADAARMDSLFRQSGLMREKWDTKRGRDTYGQITIAKAIAQGGKVYDPTPSSAPTSPAPTERRGAPKSKEQGAQRGDQADAEAQAEAGEFPLNDIGNGKRLAAMFRRELRFCGVREQWQFYAGGRWQPDETGEAERRAKDVERAVAAEAANQADDDKRARLLKHAVTLTKRGTRETMLKDAASEPGMMVSPELFDANCELLNCKNGTLDLCSFEFRAHAARDLLTLQTSVNFDPRAECPTWRKCIAQWMPREGVADYVQDSAGLSLTGRVFEEFFNLLIGPGDNGKSTAMRVLEKLAGQYWTKTEAETLMKSRDGKKAEAPAPSLLALKGARLVTVHEIDAKHELNAALIKDLTGRDAITARGLFEKRPTTFSPQFTLWAFGNSKPKITDDSNGMWRRVRIIDFDQTIPADQRDPNLSAKLEAELSGILNWALEGLRRVQLRGLLVPDAVSAATAAYRAEQDPFAGFLNDECELHPHATDSASELFAAWCAWCRDNGEKEGTQTAFGTALKSKGLKSYRGNGGRRWRGITHRRTVAFDTNSEEVSKQNNPREDFIGNRVKHDGATVVTDQVFDEETECPNLYGND